MLEAMPEVSISDITIKAIEELFEGRNEKEYAQICIREDISELLEKWRIELGLTSELTLTGTDDGFRVVVVALKKYGSLPKSQQLPTKNPIQEAPPLHEEDFDAWVDQDD